MVTEQEINKLLQDAFMNEEVGTDIMNFAKLLVIKACPHDKVPQLQKIIDLNDIRAFTEFAHTVLPDFDQQMVAYLKSYGYLQ